MSGFDVELLADYTCEVSEQRSCLLRNNLSTKQFFKLHVTIVGFECPTLFLVNFLNKAKETVVTNVHMKIRMMDASSFSEA